MVAGGKLIPNLVITDMSVTGPASPEFVRYCNANDIPVVVFSASLNPALRSEILRLGVKEFVEKPYNIDEYTTALWTLIWKWASRR
jgi:CheY-like chemotaxis protein